MSSRVLFFLLSLVVGLLAAGAMSHAQETSARFRQLDRNGDGKLTKDEFSGPIFDRLDSNQDGVVSAEEDRAFMRSLNRDRSSGIPDSVTAELDIAYAGTKNPRQSLDLYRPSARHEDKPLPVVVFIHGGGWQNGDKRGGYRMIAPLVESGKYAGVSVGYRLSGEATWPAQIHDCKAAIRWLRANASDLGLDPKKIGVTGTSAGGHLVAMLGTSGEVSELEGQLGAHTSESSAVTCVVDQFGPSELLSMGGWHDNPDSPEAKLIGGTLQENQEAAKNASPISYVSKDDPPFLLIHGTADRVVPFDQSKRLHEALVRVGVDSVLVPVEGGGHGGFPRGPLVERMTQFFDKHLLGREGTVSSEPIQSGEPSGQGSR